MIKLIHEVAIAVVVFVLLYLHSTKSFNDLLGGIL